MYYDWRTLPEMVGWFYTKEGRVILNISKNVSQNKQQTSATFFQGRNPLSSLVSPLLLPGKV